jgi:hypothetical protein
VFDGNIIHHHYYGHRESGGNIEYTNCRVNERCQDPWYYTNGRLEQYFDVYIDYSKPEELKLFYK